MNGPICHNNCITEIEKLVWWKRIVGNMSALALLSNLAIFWAYFVENKRLSNFYKFRGKI